MPKVKVNDIEIYYEVHGDGFPITIIMGYTGNIQTWYPDVVKTFAKHFKTIIFDSRGVGQTDKPDMKYSIPLFTEDTIGLLEKLNIEKTHVLGVSSGGLIAQELALTHPEKVEKLVLCTTHCGVGYMILPKLEVLKKLTLPDHRLTPEEVRNQTIPILYSKEYIESHPEEVQKSIERELEAPITDHARKQHIDAMMNFKSYRRLKHLQAPTLILQGGKDELLPPENAKILEKRIPNTKLVIFKGAAHALIQEVTQRFTQLVIEFLAEPEITGTD